MKIVFENRDIGRESSFTDRNFIEKTARRPNVDFVVEFLASSELGGTISLGFPATGFSGCLADDQSIFVAVPKLRLGKCSLFNPGSESWVRALLKKDGELH